MFVIIVRSTLKLVYFLLSRKSCYICSFCICEIKKVELCMHVRLILKKLKLHLWLFWVYAACILLFLLFLLPYLLKSTTELLSGSNLIAHKIIKFYNILISYISFFYGTLETYKEFVEEMPWVVLRFPESETIEAVPAKWYDKANKLCKFPPVDDHTEKELSNFIIEEYDPLEEWPIHEAVLESQTEFVLFNKAHIRASKACNSQNYKSDKETVLPQKRPPKPRKIASSSSEQDSDGSDLVFEHSFPKSKKEQHEKCTPSKSRTHPNIGLENKQEVKTVQETSKPTPTNANAQETAISYLIRIKRTLELQEQKLSEIDRKVDELSTIIRGQQKSTDITDDEVHKKLPLSTFYM
ncbi:uncharacterized protein LOC126885857 isoform X1 [Diabrotica virgifera virgifera]|uniref:Uncharacterized protein n=2 Tax=Diabrotica virgifera virgifera TaxID=50390 RepID=A0ABM5KEG8_DIAVI|nr:uncharacterized protein LOC126885857 isoform X1 [Diabrotica virgifera virgifera]